MWIRRLSEAAIAVALATVACPAIAQAQPQPQPAAAPDGAAPAQPADDATEQYRERFKLGMDRYRAGALAEAIAYWEPIYREMGEKRGYRLAYNLGVAYAEFGDATRAADRLHEFVAEVDARRGHGEEVEPIVAKEEADARGRIAGLIATKGRIHVAAATPPRGARVDAGDPRLAGFTVWVTPGVHTITFAPGRAEQEQKSVTVRAGESVEVAPTPEPPVEVPEPAATAAPPPPPPTFRKETVHPVSPTLLVVSGGLAVAATVVAVPLNVSAWGAHNKAQGESGLVASDNQAFWDARTLAYTVEGAAIGLATVTAALAAWYFLGTSSREVVIAPGGVAGRF